MSESLFLLYVGKSFPFVTQNAWNSKILFLFPWPFPDLFVALDQMDSHRWLIILCAVIWTNSGFVPKLKLNSVLSLVNPVTASNICGGKSTCQSTNALHSFCTENSALEAFSPGEWEKIKEVIMKWDLRRPHPVSQNAVGQIPYFIFTLGLNSFSLLYSR